MKTIYHLLHPLLLLTFLFQPTIAEILAQPATWQSVNGLNGGTILALASAPEGDLYASVYGGGIYRSPDNGQNWTLLTNGLVSLQGIELFIPEFDLYELSVEKMIVDSEGIIYAAPLSGYGLFRSMDGGSTWSQMNSEFLGLWITDLEVSNGGDLFVATYRQGVYRLSGQDENWTLFGFVDTVVYDLKILNDASIFAGTEFGLYRSSGKTANWRKFGSFPTRSSEVTEIEISGQFVFAIADNSDLFVFATSGFPFPGPVFSNPDGIFGLSAWDDGNVAFTIPEGGMYVSTRTDAPEWEWSLLAFDGKTPHVLSSDPDRPIMVGIPGEGLLYSFDNGNNWESRNNGIHAQTIYRMFRLNNDKLIISSLGPLFQSLDGGESWQQIATFGSAVVSLLEMEGEGVFAGTSFDGLYYSPSGNMPWEKIGESVLGRTIYGLVENQAGHIFVASNNGLFRSTDNGKNWQFLRSPFGVEGLVITTGDELLIFADESLFYSTDDGNSWVETSSLPESRNLQGGIFINDQDHIFLQLDGLYRSTDRGETWELLGFENRAITSVAFSSAGHILVSSIAELGFDDEFYYDNQVFVSEDDGESWSILADGLSHTLVTNLVVTGKDRLYAATFGSGLYYLDLGNLTATTSFHTASGLLLEQNYPNPFGNQTAIEFDLPESAAVSLFVTDAQGRRVATLIDGWLMSGEHRVSFQPREIDNGVYFYTLTVGELSLSRRMLYVRH